MKPYLFLSANKCNEPTVPNAHYSSWFGAETDLRFVLSCYRGYQASDSSGFMKCGEDGELIEMLECLRKKMQYYEIL